MADLENFDGQEMLDKVQEKFKANQNYVYIALAAILIGIVAIWWFKKNNAEKNLEASAEVWKSEFAFAKDSFNLAINGEVGADGLPVSEGLETLADDYSGTDAGAIAKYRLGVSYLNLKKFDEAIDALEDVSFDDEVLGAVAKGALGDAYFETGKVDKAISNYKKAVNHSKNDFSAPIYLKKLGVAQEEAGDAADAKATYERILKEYPNSTEAGDIEKDIARLSN